jgi:hypothetical protein
MCQFSTLLDPRFKLAIFDEQQKRDIKQMFLTHLSAMEYEISLETPNKTIATPNTGSFMELLGNTLTSSSTNRQPQTTGTNSELIDYLNEEVITIQSDPIEWWSTQKHRYPKLVSCAKKFLAPPPGSVASERLFSQAGLLYEPDRNRLSGKHAEQFLLLKFNSLGENF